MPHKFNATRRHKFAQKRYRVTNWTVYNESLRKRGDLTVWIDTAALEFWVAPRRLSRGGQPKYPELAIAICLTLGVVYEQPLRQTQGLMRGIVRLMGLDISIPDFSTLSRRSRGLSILGKPRVRRTEPAHLAVPSCLMVLLAPVRDWSHCPARHLGRAVAGVGPLPSWS
jgi:hypothetical protein